MLWWNQSHSFPHNDSDDPPGDHLLHKTREWALDGYYIDMFTLAKPDVDTPTTGSRAVKKGKKEPVRERSFANWLCGYTELMRLISAAYPERGWHLSNHLANMLEARASVGEAAAMAYDQAFRKKASNNPRARWDLKLHTAWVVEVGPHVRPRSDSDKRTTRFKTGSGAVCWEFNRKGCQRRRCRFDHACENCGGSHAKTACSRSGGGHQPFRKAAGLGGGEGAS